MNQDMVWQLLRYALLAAGGAAVSHGWLSNEQLIALIGALGTIFVAIWGFYVKWNTVSVPMDTAVRPDVPTVSPVTGKVIPGPAFTG